MTNPLLSLGFPIPFDRIEAEHVVPAVDQLLGEAQARIDAIVAETGARTYANTLGALESATNQLELVMTVVGHLESTATSEAMREANTETRPKVSAFSSSIPTNAGLWSALKAFAETEEARTLDPTRARYLELTLDGFRRAGADLDPAGKQRLLELDVELSKLTHEFSQNVLDSTNEWELIVTDEAQLSGLPDTAIEAARENAEAKGVAGWRFTLQAPSLVPILTYLDDAGIRQRTWQAYYTRASGGEHDNRPLIARILEIRSEKARLLGFQDFTDLVLQDRMAKTGARAQEFLDDLRARSKASADKEHADLNAYRRSIEGDDAPRSRAGTWATTPRSNASPSTSSTRSRCAPTSRCPPC